MRKHTKSVQFVTQRVCELQVYLLYFPGREKKGEITSVRDGERYDRRGEGIFKGADCSVTLEKLEV